MSEPAAEDLVELASALMQSRQTILPKYLFDPGPTPAQLEQIVGAAASAPDHRQVLPWRFVQVGAAARHLLGEQFAQALHLRDAHALPGELAQAHAKAFHAPCLLLLVVDGARGDERVDLAERTLSAGCAVQNLLLMATALGFASALTSGRALTSPGMRQLFALGPHDHAICFVSLGTAQAGRAARLRPSVGDYSFHISPAGAVLPGLGDAGDGGEKGGGAHGF